MKTSLHVLDVVATDSKEGKGPVTSIYRERSESVMATIIVGRVVLSPAPKVSPGEANFLARRNTRRHSGISV
jgi:hypothetical protein